MPTVDDFVELFFAFVEDVFETSDFVPLGLDFFGDGAVAHDGLDEAQETATSTRNHRHLVNRRVHVL